MVRLKADTALALLTAFVVSIALAAQSPARAGVVTQDADRRMADLSRRLLGPPLQHADADQQRQREEPGARVGLSPQHVARRSRSSAAEGPTRPARRRRRLRTADDQGDAADGQRRPVFLRRRTTCGRWTRGPAAKCWHYFWKTRGGIHIGNRGVGMYGNWIYFLTPDNYFVSLDAATGKERWHTEIANVKREYFSTSAPIIIGKQVHHRRRRRLARRARLSRVARSGDRRAAVAVVHDAAAGQPGAETWPNADVDAQRRRDAVAARHLRSGAEPLLHRHRQPATPS